MAEVSQPAVAVQKDRPSMAEWNEEDVSQWLKKMDVAKNIRKAAIAAGIDGNMLLEMDAAAWAELGVHSALLRSKLQAQAKREKDPPAAVPRETSERPPGPERISSTKHFHVTKKPDKELYRDSPYTKTYEVPKRVEQRAGPRMNHVDISDPTLTSKNKLTPSCFEVECKCVVQNLYTTHLVTNQTFEAYLKFEARWRDPSPALRDLHDAGFILSDRIIADADEGGHEDAPCKVRKVDGKEEKLFEPRIVFRNLVEIKRGVSPKWWYDLKKWTRDDPVVVWNALFIGVFHVQIDLFAFPFDEQMLTIDVQSGWELKYHKKGQNQKADDDDDYLPWRRHGVNLRKKAGDGGMISLGITSSAVNNEYHLHEKLLFDRDESSPNDSSMRNVYSRLLISMHVQRKASNYIWNIVFPSFMISTSLLASYGIPPDDFVGRLQVTVTVLLALTSAYPGVEIESCVPPPIASFTDSAAFSKPVCALQLSNLQLPIGCPSSHT